MTRKDAIYLLNPETSAEALRNIPQDEAIALIEEACRIACEDMEKCMGDEL